jgi:hypothetical protein
MLAVVSVEATFTWQRYDSPRFVSMRNEFFAKTYGCAVVGVDLSTNMVSIAYERLMGMTASNLKVSIIGSFPLSSILDFASLGFL